MCAAAFLMEMSRRSERTVEYGTRRWTVREVNAKAVPGAVAPRCLICESDDVVRRIWHYPANWASLSDDELIGICDRLLL